MRRGNGSHKTRNIPESTR